MRLIVLDTNVLISAGISPDGPPAKIVADHVLGGTAIAVTCPSVTAEYREVFRRAKFLRYEFPPLWLEFLIDESMQLPEPAAWTHSCPDPKDAVFLALAKAARAWLVTGNSKHYPASVRSGVKVVSPREYLAKLEGE
jgi:putative PIN family toxin of toxin-antitoxin system